jgi:ABC-type Fe3+ transport system substrate-binding protein
LSLSLAWYGRLRSSGRKLPSPSLRRWKNCLTKSAIQPHFLSPSLVFMSANAPRPYTGALFIDYLLSEEGQKVIVT